MPKTYPICFFHSSLREAVVSRSACVVSEPSGATDEFRRANRRLQKRHRTTKHVIGRFENRPLERRSQGKTRGIGIASAPASLMLYRALRAIDPDEPPAPPVTDMAAGPRLEHIEQLLERLDGRADSSIPERDVMVMSTVEEHRVDATRESGEARLPRFLTLDEQVPLPLRALLDEADGCLQMSFLTGAGACAGRTLDLLLAEQGLGGVDRAEQIQQLGKKHPAIAESFLRGLSLVTNNPSGAWDEARVTLAIAILKAIAYEIYVLGPERKERASYVIDLLERFKSVGKL